MGAGYRIERRTNSVGDGSMEHQATGTQLHMKVEGNKVKDQEEGHHMSIVQGDALLPGIDCVLMDAQP